MIRQITVRNFEFQISTKTTKQIEVIANDKNQFFGCFFHKNLTKKSKYIGNQLYVPMPVLLEIKRQLQGKHRKYFSLSVKTFAFSGTPIAKKKPLVSQKYWCHLENDKVIVDAINYD